MRRRETGQEREARRLKLALVITIVLSPVLVPVVLIHDAARGLARRWRNRGRRTP